MKKKVAYMTIAILVLLISVVRIFSEPDKNPFETQPATHLMGQGIQKIVSTVLIWEKIEQNIIFSIYILTGLALLTYGLYLSFFNI